MGNFCGRQSSTGVWAGDDWGSVTKVHDEDHIGTERQRLLISEEKKVGASTSTTSSSLPSSGSIGEVKIKITKRELEELMGKAKVQGLTMEEVLSRLLENNYEEKYEMNHHLMRSWKPALQSIPE